MAYYCLHKFHLLPHAYLALPHSERAFITACVEMRVEQEKKEAQKARKRR